MISVRGSRSAQLVAIAFFATAAFVVAGVACSNNAEGERCETDNGNDDCQDGLVCTPAGQLPQEFNSGDRCCPPDRAQATTAACSGQVGVGGDAQPPADTGPLPDGNLPDTGSDTGRDAPVDAADAADADDAG